MTSDETVLSDTPISWRGAGDGTVKRRALTLWPEWCPSITLLDKRCENRVWHPRSAGLQLPAKIALHAGANIGGAGCRDRSDAVWTVLHLAADAGWLVEQGGVSRGDVRAPLSAFTSPVTSAIVAIVTVTGADQECRTPWDMEGQWHWRLADVRPLRRPVPCRGAQGLWSIPDDVLAAVREQIGEAAPCS